MNKAEDQIRRAMEEGKFDNLPGKGKPLRLEQDPFEDPEWRMAHQMLRNGGFTLPWIETRQEIERDLDTAREAVSRARTWRREALDQGKALAFVDGEWVRAEAAFRQRVAELNRRILTYNLQVPSQRLQLHPLDAGRLLEAIGASPS